jgi:anti-sigma factor RsiW
MQIEYPVGWTCEVVLIRLERYRTSTLSRSEALALAEHLEACMSCAQHLALLVEPGPTRRG